MSDQRDFTQDRENDRIQQNLAILNSIWDELNKVPHPQGLAGEYVRYIADDPKYLYYHGFVDTDRFSLEEWEKAFASSKQPDGNYFISKKTFLSFAKYRYYGYVKPPLDPMTLREGWYRLEDWRAYCVNAILPSVTLKLDDFIKAEEEMVKKGLVQDGKVFIDEEQKRELQKLLDQHPSPTRMREIEFQEVYRRHMGIEVGRSQAGESQKSNFSKGAKLGTRQSKDLKEMLVKGSQISATTATEQPATFSLKDLRKASTPKKTSH